MKTNSDLKQMKLFRQYSVMDIILTAVCRYYQIPHIDTQSPQRAKKKPMQVAMLLSRKYTSLTTQRIGSFYNKSHADVLHNCKVIDNECSVYPTLKKEYEAIRADILSRINYL